MKVYEKYKEWFAPVTSQDIVRYIRKDCHILIQSIARLGHDMKYIKKDVKEIFKGVSVEWDSAYRSETTHMDKPVLNMVLEIIGEEFATPIMATPAEI